MAKSLEKTGYGKSYKTITFYQDTLNFIMEEQINMQQDVEFVVLGLIPRTENACPIEKIIAKKKKF